MRQTTSRIPTSGPCLRTGPSCWFGVPPCSAINFSEVDFTVISKDGDARESRPIPRSSTSSCTALFLMIGRRAPVFWKNTETNSNRTLCWWLLAAGPHPDALAVDRPFYHLVLKDIRLRVFGEASPGDGTAGHQRIA